MRITNLFKKKWPPIHIYARFLLFGVVLLLSNCVTSNAILKDESIKYPRSKYVEVLDKLPNKPYRIIATIETRGTIWSSMPEVIENMRQKARALGADAIIPYEDVSQYQAPGVIYSPYLGGYQTTPGGKVPIIRGYAIIYESTIKHLQDSGYNFYGKNRTIRGGVAVNGALAVLKGYGINAWWGVKKVRFVGSYFKFNIPDAFYVDEFSKGKVESGYKIGIDIFIGDLEGFYGSFGFENWDYSIGITGTDLRGRYNMFYFSDGMGYLYQMSDHFYFDSNFCINISMSNRKYVEIYDRTLVPDKLAYNIFVGIGINF